MPLLLLLTQRPTKKKFLALFVCITYIHFIHLGSNSYGTKMHYMPVLRAGVSWVVGPGSDHLAVCLGYKELLLLSKIHDNTVSSHFFPTVFFFFCFLSFKTQHGLTYISSHTSSVVTKIKNKNKKTHTHKTDIMKARQAGIPVRRLLHLFTALFQMETVKSSSPFSAVKKQEANR